MKIAVIHTSNLSQSMIVKSEQVPRIGDRVNIGHQPVPVVEQVVWWPATLIEKLKNSPDENNDVINNDFFSDVDVLLLVK